MNKLTRIIQAGSFAIVAVAMLTGPGTMQLQAKDNGDKPVLAGPKAQKDREGKDKKFNGERKRGGDAMHKLLGDLKLSDEQKEKVKDIMVENRTARQEWKKTNGQAMKKLQQDFKTAREAKDETKAKATMQQMHELRSTMPKPQESFTKVRAVLDTEQQATFDANVEKMKEHRMGAKAKDHKKDAGENRKADRKSKDKDKKDSSEKSETQDGELDL